MHFSLKVKNEVSGIELSYILGISELEALLWMAGVHCLDPSYGPYQVLREFPKCPTDKKRNWA